MASKYWQERIRSDQATYLKEHPEVYSLLNGFVRAVMEKKPTDVFTFGRDYFSIQLKSRSVLSTFKSRLTVTRRYSTSIQPLSNLTTCSVLETIIRMNLQKADPYQDDQGPLSPTS